MRVWVVSKVHPGTLNQALGVAERLSDDPLVRMVRKEKPTRKVWNLFGPRRQTEKFIGPGPDIIVSCGRIAEPEVKTIKEAYGRRPYCVHLQPPRPEYDCFDLVFVEHHLWRREYDSQPRYRRMLGVPTTVRYDELKAGRMAARAKWGAEDREIVTFLIGGASKAFAVNAEVVGRLAKAISDLLAQDKIVLATVSRRSPAGVTRVLQDMRSDRFKLWAFDGPNPYAEFLAAADAFVVTEDSVTMTSEALISGKPVHIFPMAPADAAEAAKCRSFHSELYRRGLARRFDGTFSEMLEVRWAEAEGIARQIQDGYDLHTSHAIL
jgi:mitochondrial fission protein ELM1